jgi:hypothetical protein
MQAESLTIIGRAELICLPDHGGDCLVPAKIDTGADVSSIWASSITVEGESLQFVLFDRGSEFYTGKVIALEKGDYRLTRIASSFGHRELRYVVKLRVRILGRRFKATFTLADRSSKTYPILLGRRLLKGKFLVDVSKGSPLHAEEKAKLEALHVALANNED